MEIIFTGRKRDADALHRILRADGIPTTVMTAADPPGAAVLLSTDDPVDRSVIARAIERVERERDTKDDDVVDEDTPKRAPEGLYWRAFAAMRTAHARIEPYEQAEEALAPDDVEWAASIGLDDVYKVMRAVEAEHGVWRMAIEQAVEKAAALLMGMRAIALVLRNPLADSRREINGEDPEKRFNATNAIGVPADAAERACIRGRGRAVDERGRARAAMGPAGRGRTRSGVNGGTRNGEDEWAAETPPSP